MTNAKAGLLAVALLAIVALAGCTGGGSGPDPITASFDEDAEGWRVVGDAQGTESEPTHVDGGGDPGGYLSATDDVSGGVWYWNASPKFLGDVSAYEGGTLSFDLNQSSTSSQFDAQDVVLRSGDTRIGYDFGNASAHPGTNWTAYEVPMSADGWTNLSSGEPVTEETFEGVLSDLDELWIRGEYREGSDAGGLDSVELSG